MAAGLGGCRCCWASALTRCATMNVHRPVPRPLTAACIRCLAALAAHGPQRSPGTNGCGPSGSRCFCRGLGLRAHRIFEAYSVYPTPHTVPWRGGPGMLPGCPRAIQFLPGTASLLHGTELPAGGNATDGPPLRPQFTGQYRAVLVPSSTALVHRTGRRRAHSRLSRPAGRRRPPAYGLILRAAPQGGQLLCRAPGVAVHPAGPACISGVCLRAPTLPRRQRPATRS